MKKRGDDVLIRREAELFSPKEIKTARSYNQTKEWFPVFKNIYVGNTNFWPKTVRNSIILPFCPPAKPLFSLFLSKKGILKIHRKHSGFNRRLIFPNMFRLTYENRLLPSVYDSTFPPPHLKREKEMRWKVRLSRKGFSGLYECWKRRLGQQIVTKL